MLTFLRRVLAEAMRQPWWPPLGCPADNTDLFTVPPGELWVDMDADLTAAYEAIGCRVFTFRGETDQWLSIEDSIHVWRGVAANAGCGARGRAAGRL